MIKRIGVLLFAAYCASAATYYVATTGSDGHSGTLSQPWKTLQHAVNMVSPGDTILVEAGTYAGCRIGVSGSQTLPKTLQAARGAVVVLNKPGASNKHNSILEIENFSGTTTDWIVSGFEVTGSPKYGIDVRVTDRITIQHNHVHNSKLTGIFTAFSNHVLIQNNESDHNSEHGIYQSNSSTYPTIRGNRSHHNAAAGIHMNGDISQQPGNGLVQFALVEDNVIWENGTAGGSGINCDGVDDSLFRNNLLYSNHASGISLYAIDGAHGSSNNKVYNNTIVMPAGARWAVNIPDDGAAPAPVGNVVENNILLTQDSFRGSILVAGTAVSGFHSDYNVVVSHLSDDNGNTSLSLSHWQSATGNDVHSILASAAQLFVNPGAFNYQLKAASPAIDAGASLLDVPADIVNVPRPQGVSWDIGAYEFKQ
ncbi:MAG TPA: right-handed parallel beta-helix repeat-containing protein [Bryobacteraceae bacterium]|jgi:parallel beta-helix repeat protein|nr:right-handed parallel beta-helix repeat-containing protein [Bryobacteraceae bacterium]